MTSTWISLISIAISLISIAISTIAIGSTHLFLVVIIGTFIFLPVLVFAIWYKTSAQTEGKKV